VVDDGWMNARDASVVLSFGGLGLFMCGRFAGSCRSRGGKQGFCQGGFTTGSEAECS
jgi:hypothetical protein